MKDGKMKTVSNSRDTQEIPFEQGKIMVEKIAKYQNRNTILESFEFYDMRQENYEKNMKIKNNYQSQQQNQINNNQKNNNNDTNVNNYNDSQNKVQNQTQDPKNKNIKEEQK